MERRDFLKYTGGSLLIPTFPKLEHKPLQLNELEYPGTLFPIVTILTGICLDQPRTGDAIKTPRLLVSLSRRSSTLDQTQYQDVIRNPVVFGANLAFLLSKTTSLHFVLQNPIRFSTPYPYPKNYIYLNRLFYSMTTSSYTYYVQEPTKPPPPFYDVVVYKSKDGKRLVLDFNNNMQFSGTINS